jgi:dCTP deaminase
VRLLKDDELVSHVGGTAPLITGVPQPADWYSNDSPIQPSLIDLHIGDIFLPGVKRHDPGGVLRPKTEHILGPGRTAVVLTQEEFQLPGHIAGIGFPPSHVSFQGILMTNPGHVDPGYASRMRFTVINMGSQDYILRQGDEIVTMLLIELSGPAQRDWLLRHGGNPAGLPSQDDIDRLSADFLDVDRRAAQISQRTVRDAELDIKIRQWRAPIITAIIALLATTLGGYFTWARPAWTALAEAKKEIAVVKASLELTGVKSRLDEMERLLQTTRQAPQPASSSQGTQP